MRGAIGDLFEIFFAGLVRIFFEVMVEKVLRMGLIKEIVDESFLRFLRLAVRRLKPPDEVDD